MRPLREHTVSRDRFVRYHVRNIASRHLRLLFQPDPQRPKFATPPEPGRAQPPRARFNPKKRNRKGRGRSRSGPRRW